MIAVTESFLPRRLLATLHSSAPDGSGCVHFRGVAAVFDISGFTAMTEQLAEQGDDGVARVGDLVQRTFEQWISCIETSGGEVVRFAGDALITCWPQLPEGPEATLEMAREAAARLAACSSEQVVLHAGLAWGRLEVHRLGGHSDRWEYVLAGEALARASIAQERAGPGELRVVPIDHDAVSAPASPSPFDLSSPPSHWMRGFLPAPLWSRLTRDAAPWMVQLRQVHAIFFGIRNTAPEHDSLQSAFRSMQEVLHSFSPPTEKLLWTPDELVVRLVFGTQDNAQFDDALRAVDTALAVVHRMSRMGWHVGAGIASGQAFSGPVGGVSRQEHLTLGRPMNIAARLMREASQEVLVTRPVSEASSRRIRFRDSRQLELRGLPGRIEVQAADGRYPLGRERPQTLFGRRAELARLADAAADARVGEGSQIAIIADPGIGKTAVLLAAAREARHEGMAVAIGAADVLDQSASYHAIRGVLRTLITRGSEASDRRSRLRRSFGERWGLLSGLVPEAAEPTPWSRSLHGPSRGEALRGLLTEVFQDLSATEPLFIGIEDAHWLDSASLRLLEALRSLPRITLLITSRPPASTQDNLRGLLDACTKLSLDPLDRNEVAALTEATLNAKPGPLLMDFIESSAAGHPLYTQELALLLERVQRLNRLDGGIELRSAFPFDLPRGLETVEGLITSRIDRLDPVAARALSAASVIGPRFSLDALVRLLPESVDRESVRRTVEALVAERLLTRLPPAGLQKGPQYGFRHALTRDVSYRMLLPEQRRTLHRAVGHGYEQELEKVTGDWSALAHHFHLADDRSRSCRYSALAGEAALESGALREAVVLLRRSLELTSKAARGARLRLLTRIAEAQRGLGDVPALADTAETALELSGRIVPRDQLRSAEALLQAILPSRFAQHGEDAEESARALRLAAGAYYFQGRGVANVQASLGAYRYARRAGPSPTLSGAAAELGGVMGLMGFESRARALMREAVEVATELQDPAALGYAHFFTGLFRVGCGDWAEAKSAVEVCQPIFIDLADSALWGDAQVVRFWLEFYTGNIEQARHAAAELLIHAQETGHRQHEAWALRGRAVCALHGARWEEARVDFDASYALTENGQGRAEQIASLGGLAEARLQLGDRDGAIEALTEGLARAQDIRRPTIHIMHLGFAGLLATAAQLFGPKDRRTALLRRRLATTASVFPVGRPGRARCEGDLAWLRGRSRKAQRWWERGLVHARSLSMASEVEKLEQRLRGAPPLAPSNEGAATW